MPDLLDRIASGGGETPQGDLLDRVASQGVSIDNQSRLGRILQDQQRLPTPGILGQTWQALTEPITKQQLGQALQASPADLYHPPVSGYKNYPEAIAYSLLKQVNPLNVGTVGIAPRVLAAKGVLGTAVNAAARTGLLGLGAQQGGEALGTLRSGAPMSVQQQADVGLQGVSSPLMMLGGFVPMATPKSLGTPDFLKPVSQLPRELTPEERNLRAGLSSRTSQATMPVVQNVTPSLKTEAASIKPTATVSPEQQIVIAHKQKLQSMTPDQLRQMIMESKTKAMDLVKQNPVAAYQEAVMGQQFPREELQRRGEPLEAPLDMGQVAHSYQRPATQVQLAMQDAVKSGAITKEQQIQWNRQIYNTHQDLVQKANAKTMTPQDRDNALNVLKQIQTEVQNASGITSTKRVSGPQVRARVDEETPLQQQGKVTLQGEQTQGGQKVQVQGAPKEEVPGAVGRTQRPGGRGDVQGNERLKNLQAIPEKNRNEWQNEEIRRLLGNQGVSGQSGMIGFGGTVDLSKLGLKTGENKVSGEQLLGRVRNVLGEKSAQFGALESAGLGTFLKQPRSLPELKGWIEQNAPRVEVRKFENKSAVSEKTQRLSQLYHKFDTINPNWREDGGKGLDTNEFKEMSQLRRDLSGGTFANEAQSHWQSIAPKSEQDMPGYVEIAVVKPQGRIKDQHNPEHLPEGRLEQPQFPSSHNFPPNTLGFVRGYMETLPNGEKVFHVIEVQSDWAQGNRDRLARITEGDTSIKSGSEEPLLSHYERLALKAAIDHARSEGATKIAIQEEPSVAMQEGHDRQGLEHYQKNYEKGNQLHYPSDKGPGILGRIMEELTGDKGQKVSFGEHKMAFGDLSSREEARTGSAPQYRKDLIFRNEAGQPKTDVSARVYDISKAKKPFSLYGRSGSVFPKPQPSGKAPTKMLGPESMVSDALSKLDSRKATGQDILKTVLNSTFMNRRRGYDFPSMQSANPDLANAAAKYGNAGVVGRLQAQSNIAQLGEGLPKDEGFWKKVGAVIYEDMRRAGGSEGNPVFELKNTPLKDEASYQAALKDQNVRKAIDQWKDLVQKPATEMHLQLGGSLLDVGEETGAFANLKALFEEPEAEYTGTTPSSGPLASLKGRTAFGMQRKYSGKEYAFDARELGYRMLTKNFAKVEKDNFYKALEESGQGKLIKNKSEAPEGMEVLPNPVRMRTIVVDKDGKTQIVPQNEWLAVRPKVLSETKQVLQVSTSFGKMLQEGAPLLGTVNHALLRVQVGLGIDLGFHTANDFAATLQAFKYNLPRAALDTTKATIDYVRNDPKVQEEILNMAREGVTFRGQNVAGWGSRTLKFVDTVTRLVLNREYERGVEKGRFVNSPAERRRYVNSRAGQYNKRFMTYLQQSSQESALGAFNVAGRNFNRLSVRAMLGTPGAKAPSIKQATLNRLAVGTGLAITALVLPSVYNEAKWGDPVPKGTRLGEFAIKKNPDGSYLVEDMFKFSLLSRAGRATGLGSLMSEQVVPRIHGEQTPPLGKTLEHSGTSIAATAMQPFWGPPLSVASALATGQTMPGIGFNEKTPGEQGPPYWRAALSSVNPIAGPVAAAPDIAPSEIGNVGKGVAQRLGTIVGLKDSSKSFSQVSQWATIYKQRSNIHSQSGDYSPSEYGPLKEALLSGDTDQAKQAYQQLLHEKSQRGDMSDEEAQQHAKEDMQKYFDHLANYNFVNKEDEAKFMAGLTPKQRETYKEAQQQLKEMSSAFFQIQPKESKPRQRFKFGKATLGHF